MGVEEFVECAAGVLAVGAIYWGVADVLFSIGNLGIQRIYQKLNNKENCELDRAIGRYMKNTYAPSIGLISHFTNKRIKRQLQSAED